jgi:hypothetical protein
MSDWIMTLVVWSRWFSATVAITLVPFSAPCPRARANGEHEEEKSHGASEHFHDRDLQPYQDQHRIQGRVRGGLRVLLLGLISETLFIGVCSLATAVLVVN